MKVSEIITFIKAGYNPAEIAAMENPAETAALLNEGVKKEDIPSFLSLLAEPEEKEKEKEKTQDVTPQPEKEKETDDDPTDYKEMYQNLLKETQQKKTRENMADDMPNNQKTIEEIVRSFM